MMTDKEIQSILDELNSVRPEKLNGEARKLFDTIMQIIDEKDDIKAELQAEVIKNHYLEDKVKVYEQQIDLEWVEENYVEKRILERAEKIIDLMAEWISNFTILEKEKDTKEEVIQHFCRKVEEE